MKGKLSYFVVSCKGLSSVRSIVSVYSVVVTGHIPCVLLPLTVMFWLILGREDSRKPEFHEKTAGL